MQNPTKIETRENSINRFNEACDDSLSSPSKRGSMIPDERKRKKENDFSAKSTFITYAKTRKARHQSVHLAQERILPDSHNIPTMMDKLGKLVDSFDDVLKDLIVRQENSFIAAYKVVMSNVSKEVEGVKESYRSEKIRHKIEEKMHIIKSELRSFRDECFRLAKENKKYKEMIKEMKVQIEVLNDESRMDNYLLKKKISELKKMKEIQNLAADLKDSSKENVPSRITPEKLINDTDKQDASSSKPKQRIIHKTFMLPDSLKKLAFEIDNIYKNSPRVEGETVQTVYDLVCRAFRDKESLLNSCRSEIGTLTKKYKTAVKKHSQMASVASENTEMYKLFVQSLEETKREILMRKELAHLNERKGVTSIEERASFFNDIARCFSLSDITRGDMIKLIIKLFSSPRFLKIVEAKVFSFPCCRNAECLTSWAAEDLSQNLFSGQRTTAFFDRNAADEPDSEQKSNLPLGSALSSREEEANVSFQNLTNRNKSPLSASKDNSEGSLLNKYFVSSGAHHNRMNSLNLSTNENNTSTGKFTNNQRTVSKDDYLQSSLSLTARRMGPESRASGDRTDWQAAGKTGVAEGEPYLGKNFLEKKKIKSSSLHRLPKNDSKKG